MVVDWLLQQTGTLVEYAIGKWNCTPLFATAFSQHPNAVAIAAKLIAAGAQTHVDGNAFHSLVHSEKAREQMKQLVSVKATVADGPKVSPPLLDETPDGSKVAPQPLDSERKDRPPVCVAGDSKGIKQ